MSEGYHVIERSRSIYLGSEINEEAAGVVIPALLEFADSPLPIHLWINSCGGSLRDAFAIYDAIRLCPCEVYGYAVGSVMSAATLIFQACDERHISPNTTLNFHDGIMAIQEMHHREAVRDAKEADALHKRMLETLAQHSGMKLSKLTRMSKFGTYYTAEEAVQNGFADRVLVYKSGGTK